MISFKRGWTFGLLGWGVVFVVGLTISALGHTKGDDPATRAAVMRMSRAFGEQFPEVVNVSTSQVRQWLKEDRVVLVDTREPAEIEISMLPGAVDSAEFSANPPHCLEHKIVAYCTIGCRSREFAREMAARGCSVLNLEGGILAWILDGGQVFDPEGRPVKRVHVYGKKWDLAPTGYTTVRFGLWDKIL